MDGDSQVLAFIQGIKVPELMAVKSNVIMNPTTRDNLQKATIRYKDIASALLPSFMDTAMGTQLKNHSSETNPNSQRLGIT